MKLHRGVVIFIAIVVFFGMAAGIYADLAEDVFQYLHFSGFLAKKQITPEGKTISIPIEGDQNISITFNIYNSKSGGESLWGERKENITFDEGFFDVILGKIEPINVPFDEPYWLGVTIGDDPVEMERVKIGPSGYSYMALDSQNADTVDGAHAADLEESAETDGKIATHKKDPNAHHTKTTSFSELTDMATNDQIPNNITIMYAATAGDANTVDGAHAADLEESAEIDSKIATHKEDPNAHHTKTTSFSELTDMATDEQIPNNITIMYAATAGDANTVDGKHANEFGDGHSLDAADGSSLDVVYVNNAGNVVIGNMSPGTKLDVNGTVNATGFSGNGSGLSGVNASSVAWSSITGMPPDFADNTDDINDADADPGNEIQTLSISGNNITLSNGGGSIIAPYASNADKLDGKDSSKFGDGHSLDAVDGSPVDAVYVESNGNVGISTTDPQGKLEVNGTIVLNSGSANLDGDNINFLKNSGKLLIGWNRSGGCGETSFINNRGDGGWRGGFHFIDYFNNGIEKALVEIRGDGDVFVNNGKVYAKDFNDNTPYPKDLKTAYDAVLSMQRLPEGQYDENNSDNQLDHSKLHEFIKSSNGEHRDLSATVSAHNEVIKDLIRQIEILKSRIQQCENK